MTKMSEAWLSVDWDRAACKDTDTESWYPYTPGESNGVSKILNKICNECPIFSDCGVYAIHHEKYGFWGGMGVHERWDIRKKLNIPEPEDDHFLPRDRYYREEL